MAIISIRNLIVEYDGRRVLDGLNLDIEQTGISGGFAEPGGKIFVGGADYFHASRLVDEELKVKTHAGRFGLQCKDRK